MLSWPKGPHLNDGIWGKHWYKNINNSQKFSKKVGDSSKNLKSSNGYIMMQFILYKKIYNMQF